MSALLRSKGRRRFVPSPIFPHERGGHFARTGLNGDPHAQPRVGSVRFFRDGSSAPGFDVAADRFQKQTLTIHRDLQLVRMFEPANTIQVGAK